MSHVKCFSHLSFSRLDCNDLVSLCTFAGCCPITDGGIDTDMKNQGKGDGEGALQDVSVGFLWNVIEN